MPIYCRVSGGVPYPHLLYIDILHTIVSAAQRCLSLPLSGAKAWVGQHQRELIPLPSPAVSR